MPAPVAAATETSSGSAPAHVSLIRSAPAATTCSATAERHVSTLIAISANRSRTAATTGSTRPSSVGDVDRRSVAGPDAADVDDRRTLVHGAGDRVEGVGQRNVAPAVVKRVRRSVHDGHDGVLPGIEPQRSERQRHRISLAWHDRRVLHLVWYGLLAILLAAGLFALAARFLPAGEQIAPPLRDEPPWELPPDRSLNAEEIDTVRLPVALRGYRFAETDLLLDRLAAELRVRDDEIARLRGGAPAVAEQLPAELEPVAAEASVETTPGYEPLPFDAPYGPPPVLPLPLRSPASWSRVCRARLCRWKACRVRRPVRPQWWGTSRLRPSSDAVEAPPPPADTRSVAGSRGRPRRDRRRRTPSTSRTALWPASFAADAVPADDAAAPSTRFSPGGCRSPLKSSRSIMSRCSIFPTKVRRRLRRRRRSTSLTTAASRRPAPPTIWPRNSRSRSR